MKRHLKIIALLLLTATCLLPATAHAQPELSCDQLKIIWKSVINRAPEIKGSPQTSNTPGEKNYTAALQLFNASPATYTETDTLASPNNPKRISTRYTQQLWQGSSMIKARDIVWNYLDQFDKCNFINWEPTLEEHRQYSQFSSSKNELVELRIGFNDNLSLQNYYVYFEMIYTRTL